MDAFHLITEDLTDSFMWVLVALSAEQQLVYLNCCLKYFTGGEEFDHGIEDKINLVTNAKSTSRWPWQSNKQTLQKCNFVHNWLKSCSCYYNRVLPFVAIYATSQYWQTEKKDYSLLKCHIHRTIQIIRVRESNSRGLRHTFIIAHSLLIQYHSFLVVWKGSWKKITHRFLWKWKDFPLSLLWNKLRVKFFHFRSNLRASLFHFRHDLRGRSTTSNLSRLFSQAWRGRRKK